MLGTFALHSPVMGDHGWSEGGRGEAAAFGRGDNDLLRLHAQLRGSFKHITLTIHDEYSTFFFRIYYFDLNIYERERDFIQTLDNICNSSWLRNESHYRYWA